MTRFNLRIPGGGPRYCPLAVAACLCGILSTPLAANAQRPGMDAVVGMTLSSSSEPVQGWSIKRGLLGRAVYGSAKGKQIGTVLDVVVTTASAPYVLIIGAAGRLEIGGHSVAVALDDVVERQGVLLLPNATWATLKAMPRVSYSKASSSGAAQPIWKDNDENRYTGTTGRQR